MAVEASARLPFDGTLAKALVHKVSIDQVLLTDYRPESEKGTVLYAQLPRSHGFYCEHMVDAKRFDLVALIEICRQSCFVVAHTQFGVPLEGNGYQFLFQELDATLVGTRAVALSHNSGGQLVQLVVKSTIEREWKKKSGATYGLLWFYSLETVDGVEIAQIRIRQTWLERFKWREIRLIMKREREIAPDMEIPAAPGTELTPAEVARINPHNIVLHNLRHLSEGRYEAMARIDTRHPVLFDRATEHIYAMIQIEVCRQLALYAVSHTFEVDAFELDVWKCKSTFDTVGELQLPARATASVQVHDREQLSATVSLTISQQGRKVSVFEVGVRRMP
ncbi:AfsA-related hotdog domain-containing protein [Rhodanobacter sp. Col0626]|uniref:AfsA-related hotdog domain-containing protein n=1 Tax=Rhodanobacter sp. Col0626 TaxID=3415679 RepID=UPI003CE84644